MQGASTSLSRFYPQMGFTLLLSSIGGQNHSEFSGSVSAGALQQFVGMSSSPETV